MRTLLNQLKYHYVFMINTALVCYVNSHVPCQVPCRIHDIVYTIFGKSHYKATQWYTVGGCHRYITHSNNSDSRAVITVASSLQMHLGLVLIAMVYMY